MCVYIVLYNLYYVMPFAEVGIMVYLFIVMVVFCACHDR